MRSNNSRAPGGAGRTYAEKKNEALAAKNTAVLSYDELERIKSMCSQTSSQQDYITMRKSERQDLQATSNARVSKWPNTIQAQREKKEADRIRKLEDDEVSIQSEKVAKTTQLPFNLDIESFSNVTSFSIDWTQKGRCPGGGLLTVTAPESNR